ncbi:NADP-dependent oxidoreductase [Paenibacillus sp. PDC88]|uniref:NADP-dependent oxidoreductase n=1 Tax=Paenibacillus sp. PDC88 TaxID=1884375 RepID=UPI00089B0673|nr:NADP-dependent oxidoreductase [Paenibacillus sp. PDC88]SDW70659.1 NADPH:quinone reductase [Paenibacillus sp. PDC88]
MSIPMIKAVRVHQYGGPEQLKLEHIPRPKPLAGEVLIRIYAAGVLPYDWKYRQGQFKQFRPAKFPYIPGSSFAGIIEEVGADVTDFRKEQAVFGRSEKGTYAEYTTAPIKGLSLKPEKLTFDEAVTIPGSALTAWLTLFHNGGLMTGQRVLIHAAAGGFGMLAVQFAKWKGAHVIGTCSTNNVDFVHALGADTVIDYTSERIEQKASDVDLVIDTLGGQTLERSWSVVKQGGRLLSIVEEPSQEKAKERGIHVIKPSLNSMPSPKKQQEISQQIAQLIVEGKIKSVINKKFPLHEVQQAHELSQTGHGRGRIVLHIAY